MSEFIEARVFTKDSISEEERESNLNIYGEDRNEAYMSIFRFRAESVEAYFFDDNMDELTIHFKSGALATCKLTQELLKDLKDKC